MSALLKCSLYQVDAVVANGNVDCCCRPWYSFAATSPKDIIIMIDKSQSMLSTYLSTGQTKLNVAIQAAKTVIESLNPNDKVSSTTYALTQASCLLGHNLKSKKT